MLSIRFRTKYKPLILSGQKRGTVRKGRWNRYQRGQTVEADFSDHSKLSIVITAVTHKKFSELSEEDANRDGFENLEQLHQEIIGIYGSLLPDQPMTVIAFELKQDESQHKN